MLSLVQKHLLGFLSSRSISKTRSAKHIFALWFASATALLGQQNVTKTIQEQQLLITFPFCCTPGCAQTAQIILELPAALSSSLIASKPSQLLLCNTQCCHLSDIIFMSTDLCSWGPNFRRDTAKMRKLSWWSKTSNSPEVCLTTPFIFYDQTGSSQ